VRGRGGRGGRGLILNDVVWYYTVWLFLINRFGPMHWQSKQVIKFSYIVDLFCYNHIWLRSINFK
jgi:hypothetical protein